MLKRLFFVRVLIVSVFFLLFIDVMAMENQKELDARQLFLRREIIEKGYDCDQFVLFLLGKKGEKGAYFESWAMEELREVVFEFKKDHKPNYTEILPEDVPENEPESQKVENSQQNVPESNNNHVSQEADNSNKIDNGINNNVANKIGNKIINDSEVNKCDKINGNINSAGNNIDNNIDDKINNDINNKIDNNINDINSEVNKGDKIDNGINNKIDNNIIKDINSGGNKGYNKGNKIINDINSGGNKGYNKGNKIINDVNSEVNKGAEGEVMPPDGGYAVDGGKGKACVLFFRFYRYGGKILTSLIWSVVNSYWGLEEIVMNDWYFFKYSMCSGYRLQPDFVRHWAYLDMNFNFLAGAIGFFIRFLFCKDMGFMIENVFDFFNINVNIKVSRNLNFAINIVGIVRSFVLLLVTNNIDGKAKKVE